VPAKAGLNEFPMTPVPENTPPLGDANRVNGFRLLRVDGRFVKLRLGADTTFTGK